MEMPVTSYPAGVNTLSMRTFSRVSVSNLLSINKPSQLVWQRGEDQKSSKVFVQLDGVSIAEENDWLRMSDFHAEWSKKFFDTLVPYIKN